jgi:signal transduction histidine kinase
LLRLDAAQMLVYEDDETVTAVAWWSRRVGHNLMGSRMPLEGDSLANVVYRTRLPARIDSYANVTGTTAERARAFGVHAAVGCPIVVEGRLWGLLAAGLMRPEPLPAGTEARLGAFAELVATAISNMEARTEVERLAAEQAALRRVATLVASGVPPTVVFAAVAAEIAELLGVPHAGLVRYGPDRTATTVASTSDRLYVGRSWTVPVDDGSVLATVLSTGRPARVDGYADLDGRPAETARELEVESGIGVPIIVSGRVWGCVAIGVPRDHLPLAANAVGRLTAFTELVVTAISNAEAREEVTRLADEQAALRRVATLAAQAAPPAELFAAVTAEVGQLLPADLTALSRYESDGTVTVLAGWRKTGDLIGLGARLMLGGPNISTLVWETGGAARVDGYEDDSSGALAALISDSGIRSAVGTPIVVEGRLWGVMIAACTSGESLPADAEARLTAFTDLVATAISNAETRAELAASRARVVAAADDTRRRLERDLHDGIQQRLVSLALEVRTAQAMAPEPAKDLQGQLSRVVDGLGAALDDLREVSRGIHPAILSEGGLGPALNALARRSTVPVTLDVDLDARLDEPVEAAAYYVVSEALANAAKHAEASVVELRVSWRDRLLSLAIRDDGIGGADPSRGSGLIGLTDRVEALGGTISLVSPAGGGTSLDVQLPVG